MGVLDAMAEECLAVGEMSRVMCRKVCRARELAMLGMNFIYRLDCPTGVLFVTRESAC